MKNRRYLLLALFLIFCVGIGLGYYIRSQMFNPRATIPSVFERLSAFSIQQGEKEDDDLLYYKTDLADFINNGSRKTKVSVEGIVDKVAPEPDGDHHIIIRPESNPPGLYLVTEFIPEIKLTLPKAGDHIRVWGIVRFDVLHNWWEIHPVIGWDKL